jgi:ABC-type transport system involved in cytochrome bd biosynthesis fused ATPase/permease subunit
MLKVVIFLTLFLTISSASANENIERRKEHFIKMLEERIAGLQEAKACATGAQTHDALKACHEKMKKNRREIRDQHREERNAMIDERIKHLQEQKEKLNAPAK